MYIIYQQIRIVRNLPSRNIWFMACAYTAWWAARFNLRPELHRRISKVVNSNSLEVFRNWCLFGLHHMANTLFVDNCFPIECYNVEDQPCVWMHAQYEATVDDLSLLLIDRRWVSGKSCRFHSCVQLHFSTCPCDNDFFIAQLPDGFRLARNLYTEICQRFLIAPIKILIRFLYWK